MIQVSSTKQNVKDVSGLDTCMDYFELPGRICKSLNFPAEKNLATCFSVLFGREIKISNFKLLPEIAKYSIRFFFFFFFSLLSSYSLPQRIWDIPNSEALLFTSIFL
jgi:hypothetical protein